jgi:hypothetical protein
MRHNVLPGEYYAYALWHPNRRVNIDNYLYSKEGPRLFKLINCPAKPNPIDDKLLFHDLCKAHAVPSPEILATFSPRGGTVLEFESNQPPKRDLFVKPRIGLGGDGTERFRWKGGAFESDRGFRLTPEKLCDYLATRACNENRDLLVQPALLNHCELGIEADANLATARLVTGISTNNYVTPIVGFMYLSDTKQLSGPPLVALIDVTSGQLTLAPPGGCGTNRSAAQLDKCSHHPQALPDWRAVLRHTKVAHQACPDFVFLGWDVAFTENGPMILEGNAHWCADEYQRLQGEPLGHTRFADILAARLRRRVGL